MTGKVVLAFLLLVITAFFSETFAMTTSNYGKIGIRNGWGFIKCAARCRKSNYNIICSYNSGQYMSYGEKTYECLRKNCGGGGNFLHPGRCDNPGYARYGHY